MTKGVGRGKEQGSSAPSIKGAEIACTEYAIIAWNILSTLQVVGCRDTVSFHGPISSPSLWYPPPVSLVPMLLQPVAERGHGPDCTDGDT